MHFEKQMKYSQVLLALLLIVGLAIAGSLSSQALTTKTAYAANGQNQNTGETSKTEASQQNATASEAARNATTSSQKATAAAGNAAAAAGSAIGNATTAAGSFIGGAISNVTSSLKKTIANPIPAAIIVTPDSVNAGDLVVVKGTGFSANDTISLTFDNSSNTTTAKSDKTGTFNATMTSPQDAKDGPHAINATDSKGKSATATVTILAPPSPGKEPFAPTSLPPSRSPSFSPKD